MTGLSASSLTRRLADFGAGLRYEDVPADVLDLVKLHLVDTIGCALAGAGSDLAKRCRAVARLDAAAGPCAVLGTPHSLGPAAAAFANAAAMNALDYDDGFEVDGRGLGHPGATLVAAALSGAAMRPVDGRTFLAALAAAYEINGRLILSIQPSVERFRHVYGVGQHQTIAAAAVYGRLAGLDAPALANALGFAGTLTPLASLRKYNWDARPLVSLKDFNAPAAETGVRAVQFSQAGLIGAADVLDGETGFWRMIGSDRFDASILADGLGHTWWARHASLKPYPACRWMHTALESLETLRDRENLEPGSVRRITVMTSAGLARDFMDREPVTMVDRQFSLPVCLANVVCRVPRPLWHEPGSADPAIHRGVAARVEAEIDPEIDALMSGEARRPAGQVRVELDGRSIEGPRLLVPLGTRERPLARHAVLDKFRENAAAILPPPAAEEILRLVFALESCPDVAALSGLCRVG